jgi:hypothetical protein
MGIVSEIIKKGYLHEAYPAESPAIHLDKEQQQKLNQGDYLLVVDTKYNARYLVRKENVEAPLTVENIIVDSLDKMFLNEVRQKELNAFYTRFPKYHP